MFKVYRNMTSVGHEKSLIILLFVYMPQKKKLNTTRQSVWAAILKFLLLLYFLKAINVHTYVNVTSRYRTHRIRKRTRERGERAIKRYGHNFTCSVHLSSTIQQFINCWFYKRLQLFHVILSRDVNDTFDSLLRLITLIWIDQIPERSVTRWW